MSAKPENNFILSVNRLLPLKKVRSSAKALLQYPVDMHLHYEKMHNSFRGGTWDGWYSGKGGDLWIEYKFLPRIPQRASVKPFALLSPLQLEWGRERLDEGRNVAVIIGCPTGGVLLRELDWEKELSPQQFDSLLSSRVDLASWIMEQTTR